MITLAKLLNYRLVMSRLLWYTGAGRYVTIERGAYRLRFFPTALSAALWLDRNERIEDDRFLESYLRPGDRVLDVGANVGTHALMAAKRVGEEGKVFAFEPHPKTFGYLKQNIVFNDVDNIEAHCFGLGDAAGSVQFTDEKWDDQNRVMATPAAGADAGVVQVEIRCLDSFTLPPLDLVKIDAEGYELQVMRGGPRTLARARCVLYESWETHFRNYGGSCEEVQSYLRELGFRLFRFTGNEAISELREQYSSPTCENLLALRDVGEFARRTGYLVEGSPELVH